MVSGREPFGRDAFKAAPGAANALQISEKIEIVELQVFGSWAFTRNRIEITVTPSVVEPIRRRG